MSDMPYIGPDGKYYDTTDGFQDAKTAYLKKCFPEKVTVLVQPNF